MFRYSSRFWLYAPICAFLLIAAAVGFYWYSAAAAFEQKLARLKGHDAVPGITLDWDSVSVGGFPFRLEANFTNFRAKGAGARGPFAWTSEKFAMHALTYGRATIIYEAAGKQDLAWTGAESIAHHTSFVPGTLHASSTSGPHGLARFDLDLVDAGNADFTAQRLQFHLRRDPDGKNLDVMLSAANATLASKPVGGEAYVTLNKAAPLMPLLAGTAGWPDAARDWRVNGGTLKVTRGELLEPLRQALAALLLL